MAKTRAETTDFFDDHQGPEPNSPWPQVKDFFHDGKEYRGNREFLDLPEVRESIAEAEACGSDPQAILFYIQPEYDDWACRRLMKNA